MKKLLLLFILAFLVQSCARVGSPVGGPKDSLAPKFLSSNIDSTRVNVSRDIHELRLDFDEYVTLKDVNKNLIISPPIKKIKRILPSGIANKYVLIQWEDTLQANTTYNFNFGNSIADNNESNVLPYFNFAFSTGEKLDDLYISGEIKDALNTKKQTSTTENKLVVGLYQVKDTINYKQKPYYITKVDTDGYYELNYLSPGKYKIIAFEDENGNSVYDPGKEKVGFQKDFIDFSKSISGLNLKVYPSKKPLKYGEMKESPGGITMTFEGHPNDVKVLSLNDKIQDYKVTHTPKSDTVKIWFDAVKDKVGQETTENLKFSYDADKKQDTVSVFYKYNSKNKMNIANDDGNLLPPKTNFKITSNYIINKIEPEKWTLKTDSVTARNFTAKISETNPYQILVESDFEMGKKYQLTVPSKTVSSFYDKTSESKRFDFEADKVENYGSLTFKLQNRPENTYFWIQLLDGSEKVLYQKYVNSDEVKFDILKPADYVVRILVDNNGNKYWDEADFEHDIFAEDSFVYYKTALVKQLWDSVETWDLNDKRTLDNPKGTVTPVPAPTEETKETTTAEGDKPVLKDSNNTQLKSNTEVVTPVK